MHFGGFGNIPLVFVYVVLWMVQRGEGKLNYGFRGVLTSWSFVDCPGNGNH